ncbi:hypothetical protein M2101_000951 [Parabacteroides sp. PM5-20]|uniref:hypothetical protein n=1 Tax=Parabacteroides sp. PM5-20 TaxID=2940527 RepID=UPI0013CFE71C|nr:hypothetical protein [Parabacteroides sp. PM5-20]MDH6534289.1 hypothetical protein [Parabacteroides sp. PM5-20]
MLVTNVKGINDGIKRKSKTRRNLLPMRFSNIADALRQYCRCASFILPMRIGNRPPPSFSSFAQACFLPKSALIAAADIHEEESPFTGPQLLF